MTAVVYVNTLLRQQATLSKNIWKGNIKKRVIFSFNHSKPSSSLKEDENFSSIGNSEYKKIADIYRKFNEFDTQLSEEKNLNQREIISEKWEKYISEEFNTLDTLDDKSKSILKYYIHWSQCGKKKETILEDLPIKVFGSLWDEN